MEYQPVDSEAIDGAGYDDSRRTLGIKFTTGSVYWYFGVARWEYDELRAADSIGAWFNAVFKPRGHRYAEIYRPADRARQPPRPPRRGTTH